MGKQRPFLVLIVVLVIFAIVILAPIRLPLIGDPQLVQGLDLQGGSQLTLQIRQTNKDRAVTREDIEAIQNVVEKRINALGVSEALVQIVGNDQLLVQLPGVKDPQEAERVLGGTAQLEFRRETSKPEVEAQLRVRQAELIQLQQKQAELVKGNDEAAIAANSAAIKQKNQEIQALSNQLYESVGLSGKNLKNAFPEAEQNGDWSVGIEFDNQGAEKFAELTKTIAGTGRGIGIFLDKDLISNPVVDVKYAATGISGGRAVISGNFTARSANELAVQLRGGALPFPVEVVENRTVGATLGRDSVQRSIYAGVVGLALVLIFMVVYYRLPGLIADIALAIYTLLTLATFALLGVTLTLPGIAGFILSIGMAVDANVLIFERTREELRAGKSLYRSVESGFYRAFSSILDSNVTTWIACAALFWLGTGLVKGFALTLALGVAVSMFTAITCSRTLLMLAISIPEVRKKPTLFAPKVEVVR